MKLIPRLMCSPGDVDADGAGGGDGGGAGGEAGHWADETDLKWQSLIALQYLLSKVIKSSITSMSRKVSSKV